MDGNNNQSSQQNSGQTPQDPGTAPILDVQPPKQENVVAPPPAQDQPANESQVPVSTDVAKSTSDSVENTTAETTVAPNPVHRPELTASQKHKTPVLIIVIAILIAAALAVFTILAFTQQDKTTVKQQPANGTAQQSAESVTPESVDQTAGEVDSALNDLDAASDFPENELSDSNLGL